MSDHYGLFRESVVAIGWVQVVRGLAITRPLSPELVLYRVLSIQ